jgi:hypothetical protein
MYLKEIHHSNEIKKHVVGPPVSERRVTLFPLVFTSLKIIYSNRDGWLKAAGF